ncbi:MAG: glycosyltransferase family 4 protein [Pseudohongiellaceae bacterium]
MKLAFVLFSYFPYGGLQRDFSGIVQACQARGASITVFTMAWKGSRSIQADIHLYPGSRLTATARRRQFVEYVRQQTAADRFDAVIGFNRMPGLDFYFAADTCFAEKALRHRNWLYRLTPRCRQYLDYEEAVFSATGNTRIFMISPLQQQQYLKHYCNAARRMISLPPGISEDRKAGVDAARLRAEFRRELGLQEQHMLVLQVGSGFAVKGVDRALKAIAALDQCVREQVRYVLVGDDRAMPYRRLAHRLNIGDIVTILPGRDDIPSCLQGADLLIHPAYSESAGLVLVEAIVAGLPVLTTDTCGFAEHVERADAGLICHSPFSQDHLNRMLAHMLTGGRLEHWHRQGLRYGQKHDLYHMQETVADILCRTGNSDAKN